MRRRAKSCFVDSQDDSLQQKFEGVPEKPEIESPEDEEDDIESDVEQQECGEEEEEEDQNHEIDLNLKHNLTPDELKNIVDVIRSRLNEKEKVGGSARFKKLPWNELKFNVDSSVDVKAVLNKVMPHIRKLRNLHEMLDDFQTVYLELTKPKKPLNMYALFTSKHYPELQKEFPQLKMFEITKKLSQMYREISEEERKELQDIIKEKTKKYDEEVKKLPKIVKPKSEKEVAKTLKTEKKSYNKIETPFSLYFASRKPDKINRSTAKEEWLKLSMTEKVKWIKKVFGDKGQDEQANRKSVISKDEIKMMEKFDGKPESVGTNAYLFYMKNRLIEMGAGGSNKEKFKTISLEYKSMTEAQKNTLQKDYDKAKKRYIADYLVYVKKLPKELAAKEIIYLNKLAKGVKECHMDDSDENEKSKLVDRTSCKIESTHSEMKQEHKEQKSDSELEPEPESELKVPTPDPKSKPKSTKRKRAASKDKENEEIEENVAKKTKKGETRQKPDKSKATKVKEPAKPDTKSVKPAVNSKQNLSEDESSSSKGTPSKDTTAKSTQSKGTPSKRTSLKGASSKETPSKETSLTEAPSKPTPSKSSLKKSLTTATENKNRNQPEKPPFSVIDYYRECIYKGTPKKCAEAFSVLPKSEKDEITRAYNIRKQRYISELKVYLKTLSPDLVKNFFSSGNRDVSESAKKKSSQESDEDSDSDSDSD